MNATDNCRTDLPQKTYASLGGLGHLRQLSELLRKGPEEAGNTPVQRAIDAAWVMLGEAFDTACEVELSQRDAVAVARTAGLMAVQTYAAELQADTAKLQAKALRAGLADIAAAIREAAPELAGAVSEAGTDIGAGLLAALSTLAPGGEPATL